MNGSDIGFIIFMISAIGTLLAFVGVIVVGEIWAEKRAWKSKQRFVVRQVQNGVTVREWICARYSQSGEKIYFYQEGHKQLTYVAGQWHVEPVLASELK